MFLVLKMYISIFFYAYLVQSSIRVFVRFVCSCYNFFSLDNFFHTIFNKFVVSNYFCLKDNSFLYNTTP